MLNTSLVPLFVGHVKPVYGSGGVLNLEEWSACNQARLLKRKGMLAGIVVVV